jgi:hypothetical protein
MIIHDCSITPGKIVNRWHEIRILMAAQEIWRAGLRGMLIRHTVSNCVAIAIQPFHWACEGGGLNMSGLRQVRQDSYRLEKQRM